MSASSSLQTSLPSDVRRSSWTGRPVDPTIGIDHESAIGRILERVVAVSLGQSHQIAAVETDTIVVDKVGILIRILAAGVKPDLTRAFIDPIDSAYHIRSVRDRVLDRAGLGVDQVEMPPAVALGDVDDLARLLQPVDHPSRTLSAWAVQIKVWLFSSMILRASPVCVSTSISRNRWWPRSVF